MKKIFITIFCIFYSFSANAEIKKLKIQFQVRPPYFIVNSKTGALNAGVLYLLVNKIMGDTKIPYGFEEVPFPRSIIEIKQNQERVCIPSAYKNKEREAFSNFSAPFFQEKKSVIVIRNDDKRFSNFEKISDLLRNSNLKLLLKIGYSYGHFVDEILKKYKNYSSLQTTSLSSQNLSLVSSNNVEMLELIVKKNSDYMIIGRNEIDFLLGNYEIFRKRLKIKSFDDMPEGEFRYFMCSKVIEKSTIERINISIGKLVSIEVKK